MVIIGIDPGTGLVGYGVIQKKDNRLQALDYGCIKTSKNETLGRRLLAIHRDIKNLIKKFKPDLLAAESLFFFKNLKTAINVSQARGVIVFAAAEFDVPFCEYTPLEVKQAVTGYGRAEKMQIQKMVKAILNLSEIPKPDDAADALAVAICAAHSQRSLPRPSA
ncbi:MAG: crossover junction endodeoxyribonuclease RuvC [bacterium]|nr:crossover junction endodeoxyribonuclease RuvC [bacterium]